MPKLDVSGINIYYEIHGSGEQSLVFLHGLGSSHRDWQNQVSAFESDYQIVLIDLRGFGYSDKPTGVYTVAEMATEVYRVLLALQQENYHIIGLSLGGMVALQYAVNYPGHASSFVIVNAVPEFKPKTVKARFDVWLRFALVRLFGMRAIGKVLAKRLFPDREQSAMRERFLQNWKLNEKHAYLASMRAIVNWSVLNQIVRIKEPVIFISGALDYISPTDKQQYLKYFKDSSMIVIGGSRHATPVDSATMFNTHLRELLHEFN